MGTLADLPGLRATSARASTRQDVRPCPRCGNPQIGDASALHKVLKPARVTSHDRRDDARIADDDDDRQRTYYDQAIAVDIDPAHIEAGSWRHAQGHLRRGLHQARDRPALQPRRGPRRPAGRRSTSPARRPGSARSAPACPAAAPPSTGRTTDNGQDPAGQLRIRLCAKPPPALVPAAPAPQASTLTSSSRTCSTPRRCASWCRSRPP